MTPKRYNLRELKELLGSVTVGLDGHTKLSAVRHWGNKGVYPKLAFEKGEEHLIHILLSCQIRNRERERDLQLFEMLITVAFGVLSLSLIF